MSIPIRASLKRAAELGLRGTIAPLFRRALRQRAVIFAYHNVVPDRWTGGGDRSLHLPLSDFCAQLDILQATHDIVPLRQLLQLVEATQAGKVALGAHSWSHPNLARVDDERLTQELTKPLAWLRERFPERAVPLLAYPYGRSDSRVVRGAAAAGYEAAFAIDGGWVPAQIEKSFAIPRVNVPAGVSANGFALRASGLLV